MQVREIGVSSSIVELGSGVSLSYASVGEGDGSCVVLLPGPTDSWRSYEPVLRRLPVGDRAVAVTPRGHGDSDKPESGYGVADFATDTVLLLDALAIERAVLVGHSGSCMTARRVALDHPQRVAGLVLEASPMTLVGNTGLEDFVSSVVADLQDPISPEFVRGWIGDTSSEGIAGSPETDLLVAEVLKVPAFVWKETLGNLVTYDDTGELGGIAVPTRLIWGDADPLVTREAQDAILRAVPSAALSIYEGAGHTPRWEEPDRFAREVSAFATHCAA